jgi:uncharacterized protein
MQRPALLVIAKQPLAGRVKTRLTPPCTPQEAAALAGAALRDTLETVANTPAARRVLVFEGDAEGWRPDGFELITQRGSAFGDRLQAAFDDMCHPALLIGMDTPQVTPAHLTDAMAALGDGDTDTVLGPTLDGGYWCVGFRRPLPGAFHGVPMSAPDTYEHQKCRLAELGASLAIQPTLRDVDTIDDAVAVAASAPGTRFAQTFEAIS